MKYTLSETMRTTSLDLKMIEKESLTIFPFFVVCSVVGRVTET